MRGTFKVQNSAFSGQGLGLRVQHAGFKFDKFLEEKKASQMDAQVRRGDNFKCLDDFHLEAKARIWP